MIVDLHTHSHFSDGELSPDELIALVAQRNVKCVALTDHDTTAGLDIANKAAKKHHMRFIPGIEFSASWSRQTFHIVGLHIDKANTQLQQAIKINQHSRIRRNQQILTQLAKNGINLNEIITQNETELITRTHIAKAIHERGLAPDLAAVFKRYLRPGKSGYVSTNWLTIADVCAAINTAGGVAVLAHPLRYKLTATKLKRLISENRFQGLDAIEILSGPTSNSQFQFIKQVALDNDMAVSVGSDFHHRAQRWALPGKTFYDPDLRTVW